MDVPVFVTMRALVLFAGLGVGLAGCGLHQDIALEEPDAMKPGPGLFSGEKGAFVLFGGGDKTAEEGEEDDAAPKGRVIEEDGVRIIKLPRGAKPPAE